MEIQKNQTFYLVSTEYVGPNKKNSHGAWRGDSTVMSIQTVPGVTKPGYRHRQPHQEPHNRNNAPAKASGEDLK